MAGKCEAGLGFLGGFFSLALGLGLRRPLGTLGLGLGLRGFADGGGRRAHFTRLPCQKLPFSSTLGSHSKNCFALDPQGLPGRGGVKRKASHATFRIHNTTPSHHHADMSLVPHTIIHSDSRVMLHLDHDV